MAVPWLNADKRGMGAPEGAPREPRCGDCQFPYVVRQGIGAALRIGKNDGLCECIRVQFQNGGFGSVYILWLIKEDL